MPWTRAPLALAAAAALAAQGGTWTAVPQAPAAITVMLLLPDATVFCASGLPGNACYRLTPDATGNYANGTWSQLASMIDTRLYFQSHVLRDGRVYVSGGEYGTGYAKAEIYDPQLNVWTALTPPAALWNPASDGFSDCCSEVLPNGSVLLMPVQPHTARIGLIYNPATNIWSAPGPLAHGTVQWEATWVKLRGDSILTVDPFGVLSERYVPATNTWVADASVPTTLYDSFLSEIGPGLLLPNGNAFFVGSTGHTAIYTPSAIGGAGSWVAGPNLPGGLGAPDAPGAMLPNGRVLCAVSPAPTSANFPSPTSFYEYDPVANAWSAAPAPNGSSWNEPCYQSLFLSLPDGRVLHSHFGNDLWVYRPNGSPITTGRPVVNQITQNADGSLHLAGTGLNGMSVGSCYGDDWQMNTNYPIVRLRSGTNVYRARTRNWSNTGVQTGALPVSTDFVLPANLPAGTYSLTVSASGLESAPVSFTAPFVAWSNLGTGGMAGTLGVPTLSGVGSLAGNGDSVFQVGAARPSTAGVVVFGTAAANVPVFGGLLVPNNEALAAFATSLVGTGSLPVHWFAGIPSGFSVYAQAWLLDPLGPQGFAASPALLGTSP